MKESVYLFLGRKTPSTEEGLFERGIRHERVIHLTILSCTTEGDCDTILSMEDCIFCKIISGIIPCDKIYEDEYTFAFLDIKPLNEGHTLVIPKEHHTDLMTAPKDVFVRVMETVHMLAPIIKDVTGADGINLGNNNGAPAGQVVFHLHIHIIPRRIGDGYSHWHREESIPVSLKDTRTKILQALKQA